MDIMLILFVILVCLFTVLFAVRDEYVYRYRIRILNDERYSYGERLDRLKRLPSYEGMLFRFWRSNWDKELKG